MRFDRTLVDALNEAKTPRFDRVLVDALDDPRLRYLGFAVT